MINQLVYYLVSNHQKQLVFIRDVDSHSHYLTYLLRKISSFIIYYFFILKKFKGDPLKASLKIVSLEEVHILL